MFERYTTPAQIHHPRYGKRYRDSEFEKARRYSDEERTVRDRLGQWRDQHNLGPADDALNNPSPFLCIEIVRDDGSQGCGGGSMITYQRV